MAKDPSKIAEIASDIGKFKKILTNEKYYDNYGDAMIFTVIVVCVVTYIILNNYIQQQKQFIKSDWKSKRCNPLYIPFAGKIKKKPDQSESEATSENFSYCLGNITKSVVSDAFKPVNIIIESVAEIFKGFYQALNSLRDMFEYIRTQIITIIKTIMIKIMMIVLPLQRVIMSINDVFQKSGGLVFTAMMILTGAYMTVMAGIDSLILVAGIFLAYLVLQAAILYAIPFVGWALALAFTVLATVLTVYIAQSTNFRADAVNNSPGKETMTNLHSVDSNKDDQQNNTEQDDFKTRLKKNQKYFTDKLNSLFSRNTVKDSDHKGSNKKTENYEACFDGNTVISLWGNKKIMIKDVNVGDRLVDGSYVTAFIKASPSGQEFYNVNGVIVTGNHKLLYDDQWIPVSSYSNSIELPDYNTEFIYCINTTSKKIFINGLLFTDWDDLDEYDMLELRIKTLIKTETPLTPYCVHIHLDGGFNEDTMIELEDGRSIKISDVCVNDVLRFGENVLGIVKIDGKNVSCVKKFIVNNNTFIGGPNLLYFQDDVGIKKTVKLNDINCSELKKTQQPEFLYHLVTDKSSFYVNGVKFYDYNACIEYLLDKDSKKLFKNIIF